MKLFENASQAVHAITPCTPLGRILSVDGGKIRVSGLTRVARMGQVARISSAGMPDLTGEIVQIGETDITVLPNGPCTGVCHDARVTLQNSAGLAPCASWMGRIVDPHGRPLDGRPLASGLQTRSVRGTPPEPVSRKPLGPRLSTGSFAMNTLLPLATGQRIGLFAGSGVGKSSLMGVLATSVSCDVTVIALVGERSREIRAFAQDVLGEEALLRSVIVAAPSDHSALDRRQCLWSAMTVAEYFRDQGKSVLFLADSITRFAEAHREIATQSGELPVLRGFPASTTNMITELCERAGPGPRDAGDITAVMTVLVQGSDFDEPVSDILRGVLDGHIVLSRSIAERGRYPAIDLLKSVSRSLPGIATAPENELIEQVRHLMSVYEESAIMVRSGLYSEGSDPELDKAVRLWPELDRFLGQVGPSDPRQCFDRLRLILRKGGGK